VPTRARVGAIPPGGRREAGERRAGGQRRAPAAAPGERGR
jgi:hypothetical protein